MKMRTYESADILINADGINPQNSMFHTVLLLTNRDNSGSVVECLIPDGKAVG